MTDRYIHVAVAAIVNSRGEVLVSRRRQDGHLGGYWEFPGGKLEQGESIEDALDRELSEELGIAPLSSRPLIRARYHYPEKSVLLDVWRVDAYAGIPRGIEGQPLQWCNVSQLDATVFPPADLPVIKALDLPDRYLITGCFSGPADFEQRLAAALENGIELVQLRLTHDWLAASSEAQASEIIELCSRLCTGKGARLMFNVPAQLALPSSEAGLHLNSRRLMNTSSRPGNAALVSASCHNRQELERAQTVGVDFAVLSPVKTTGSHPQAKALGWEAFHALVDEINLPVYALGGLSPDDLQRSWKSGGQGIAAISALWK